MDIADWFPLIVETMARLPSCTIDGEQAGADLV
jgi:hypothetical protein